MREKIISILNESADLKRKVAEDCVESIEQASNLIFQSLNSGGKILIFGNGGSAADAQHLNAEFVNRFLKERQALASIALTTDSSVITSISNDSCFDEIFSRQIEALGKENDIAIGITTSGTSVNVINALKSSKLKGLKTIAFTGENIDSLEVVSDCIISVPSDSVPRIQEAHITIGHIICELIETLFCLENS